MLAVHQIKPTPSKPAPFRLLSVESYTKAHKNFFNHRHSFYELVLIEEGSGIHNIDFVDYTVTEPTLFCISSGQVHNFSKARIEKGGVIIFEKEYMSMTKRDAILLSRIATLSYQMPQIAIDEKAVKTFTACTELIRDELANAQPNFDIVRSAITIMLLRVLQIGQELLSHNLLTMRGKDQTVFFDFMELLEQKYSRHHDVQYYANALAVSTKYLNELVKRSNGKTASHNVQHRILTEAKRLLFYSDQSVKEIAADLGFEDASYFSRFFTKNVGVSPTNFQKHHPKNTA